MNKKDLQTYNRITSRGVSPEDIKMMNAGIHPDNYEEERQADSYVIGRRKSGRQIDYHLFMKLVRERESDLNPENLFMGTGTKREILKESGYDYVKINGGKRIQIEEASNARIGNVYRKTRRAAQRHMQRFVSIRNF